eukprot:scaffold144166_cov13-Tisochrysis_lutea.AAC.1
MGEQSASIFQRGSPRLVGPRPTWIGPSLDIMVSLSIYGGDSICSRISQAGYERCLIDGLSGMAFLEAGTGGNMSKNF